MNGESSIPRAAAPLGDRGQDADWFRNALIEMGISPCIPSRTGRKIPIPHDADLCRQRYRIENMFAGPKDWRRIATRYHERFEAQLNVIRADVNAALDEFGDHLPHVLALNMSFRAYWNQGVGPREIFNDESLGSRPFNENVFRPIYQQRLDPRWYYEDGEDLTQFYTLTRNNHQDWLSADGIHLAAPAATRNALLARLRTMLTGGDLPRVLPAPADESGPGFDDLPEFVARWTVEDGYTGPALTGTQPTLGEAGFEVVGGENLAGALATSSAYFVIALKTPDPIPTNQIAELFALRNASTPGWDPGGPFAMGLNS